jgi:hypothetical protein
MTTEAVCSATIAEPPLLRNTSIPDRPDTVIIHGKFKRKEKPIAAVLVTPAGDPWPPPYYIEGGLRRVKPYFFTYNTHAKGRWRDRELLDIFASEFRDRPIEYYVSCVLSCFGMQTNLTMS